MFGIGVQELVVVFVIALLIFGPKRLPELARGLGKGLAEFRRASNDLRQSFNLDVEPPRRPPPPPPRAVHADSAADPREERNDGVKPAQAIDSAVADKLWGEGEGEESEAAESAKGKPTATKATREQ